MTFPSVLASQWRALVETELAGGSFEKSLISKTAEGLSIVPLYTEASETHALGTGNSFRVCMRHTAGARVEDLTLDLDNGAEALWLDASSLLSVQQRDAVFVVDGALPQGLRADLRFVLATPQPDFVQVAKQVSEKHPQGVSSLISTLREHQGGADAADELAFTLSLGAEQLESLIQSGLSPTAAGRQIALQISVGRDTFLELCKLRALRVCWQKLLLAAQADPYSNTIVHAVCSMRTLTQRDPWVNMLRCTTQVFAAILGGADLITPSEFDRALGSPSALAHRIARNTGLVLREESALGKVTDPAQGSYYLETVTDQLAREGWRRFQQLEKEGGFTALLASGELQTRLDASWTERLKLLSTRKSPVLGVSEFANLEEKLPSVPSTSLDSPHRDAEIFEELRIRVDTLKTRPEVELLTLGSMGESRARVGFATGFFAAGGLRSRESTQALAAPVACICGSDERYRTEAVAAVRALKAAGCRKVLLAGKPGALETELRQAGIDGFIFAGCDVVAVLNSLVEVWS